MAPLVHFFLFYFLFASSLFASCEVQQPHTFLGRRNLLEKLELRDDDLSLDLPKKKKQPSSTTSSKNQTKLIKPSSPISNKNQTKLITTTSSSKTNKTKLIKPTSSKNVGPPPTLTKPKPKLNYTKSLDPPPNSKAKSSSNTKSTKSSISNTKNTKSPSPPTSLYQNENDNEDYNDLIAEFRDLPTKFHKTFVPDMHRISTTSKIYLTKANQEITRTFIKPYMGNNHKYASTMTTAISCAFLLVPFLLVSLIFNRIQAYFSLQKILIFTQIYLSIYFSILCLSSWVTGLEPLKFFYATSENTYVCLQVLQTLGYLMYLLMLLMYLILVFSTESGLGQKFLGLAQTFVGFAVGLHYYVTVFHRVVLHQPPKTNWKVHGIYATCFFVICLFANAERRKKAYLEEDGEEGKLN